MKRASLAGLFLCAAALPQWASSAPLEPVVIREFVEEHLIPRLLTVPLRLPRYALETATWPIKSLAALNEEYDLVDRTLDFFSFENRTVWLYPTLTYSSSDGFSFGGDFKDSRFLNSRHLHLQAGVEYGLNEEWDIDLNFYNRRHLRRPTIHAVELDFNDNLNEKFYGVGAAAETFHETVFRRRTTAARMDMGWHPTSRRDWLLLLSAGYHETLSGSGRSRNDDAVSAESVFPEIAEQGFGEKLAFFEYGAALAYDSRAPDGFPYRGGLLHLEYLRSSSADGSRFGYDRVELKTASIHSLRRKNRVLVLAVHFQSVGDDGREVPFYQLAGLGKNTFLRGYPDNRFRDRRALAGTIEYRYPIWRTYDPDLTYGIAKLFIDAGDSFDRFDELSFERLKTSYGFGVMLTTPQRFLVQAQVGFSDENVEVVLSLNRGI